MRSILFCVGNNDYFFVCRGHVLEQQPASDLVSKQESHDCPGGAWVGTGSSVAHAPPLAVLFGYLQGKLSSQNPFELRGF